MTVYQNDIVRVTAKMNMFNTDAVQNVFHIKNVTASDVTNDDFREHASKWLDALYDCVVELLANNLTFLEVELYNVTQSEPIDPIDFDTITVGENEGNTLPLQVAMLASMGTAATKVSGRKYIGGFTVSSIADSSQWLSTAITIALCMLDYLYGLQTFFTINSRPGTYNYTTETFNEFTDAAIDLIPATQRRRREGVGI